MMKTIEKFESSNEKEEFYAVVNAFVADSGCNRANSRCERSFR